MTEGPWTLPKGWRWVRLRDVTSAGRRTLDPRATPDELFLLHSIPAYDDSMRPQLVRGREVGSAKLLVESGQCLFSRLNPRLPRCWLVPPDANELRRIASVEFLPLRPLPVIDARYLRDVLVSNWFAENAQRRATGATGSRKRVPPDVVLDTAIPLPPLPEQGRIVAKLEEIAAKVEEGMELRRRAAEDTGRLLASEVVDAFARRGAGWPRGLLGDYVAEMRYGTSARTRHDPSGTPVLRMGNIQSGRLETSDLKHLHMTDADRTRYLLRRGDILVNRTNSAELVGKSAVFDLGGEYGFASYLIRIRLDLDRADPHLVTSYINSPVGRDYMFRERSQATGQANVNIPKLRLMPISLPPLPEQRMISARLAAVRTSVDSITSLHMETDAQLQAVMSSALDAAFRGQL